MSLPAPGLSDWPRFPFLVERLDDLCPPIGIQTTQPSFWHFALNSEYHLYRTLVRIMDGKALLSDYLSDGNPQNQPKWWDAGLSFEARRINNLLKSVDWGEDFWEMIRDFGEAGKHLRRGKRIRHTPEVAA